MRFRRYADRLALALTDEERIAFEFLRSRGFVYRQHFGLKNCVEIATKVFLREQARG